MGFLVPCCPSLPLLTPQAARRGQRCWWRWQSWRYGEQLGAAEGKQGVHFGHELQTGLSVPGCKG